MTAGWEPIETAPRDGSWVMLTGGLIVDGWDHKEPEPPVVCGQWIGPGESWQFAWYDGGYYGGYEKPSHWMPVPPLPTKAAP